MKTKHILSGEAGLPSRRLQTQHSSAGSTGALHKGNVKKEKHHGLGKGTGPYHDDDLRIWTLHPHGTQFPSQISKASQVSNPGTIQWGNLN